MSCGCDNVARFFLTCATYKRIYTVYVLQMNRIDLRRLKDVQMHLADYTVSG